jgi:hypothetical protein
MAERVRLPRAPALDPAGLPPLAVPRKSSFLLLLSNSLRSSPHARHHKINKAASRRGPLFLFYYVGEGEFRKH